MITVFKRLIPSKLKTWLHSINRSTSRWWRLKTAKWRKLPDFIIVGAQKSGSSTLYWWLHQHPQLGLSFDKETKFFDRFYGKGEKWFRHQFPLNYSRKLAGDNTPYYLFHPLVPERVYKMCPKAKIIMILRNPIDRAYSQYQMERRKGRESHHTFREAISNEVSRIELATEELLKNPMVNHHNHENTSYLSRGIYIEQIERWLDFFPKDRILILEHERFFLNSNDGLRQVYEFLGVRNIFPGVLKSYNVKSYPEMDGDLREDLKKFFKPYNQELENFLGYKLTWESDIPAERTKT